MILLPDERKYIFNAVVEDILKERGSATDLTDALAFAERAVVEALLSGNPELKIDLGRIVPMNRAQQEVKALFKEFSTDLITGLGFVAIDRDIYPDRKN